MNPVIQREFFGILRSPKAFAMLLVLTVVFSVAVLMRWPSDASVDLSGNQSMEVFRIFGYGLLAGVVFLVPAFPATSIVNEKNSGTLALLLNSPLNSFSIYFGKISGVLLFSLLVLLSSLPASAACFAMGGIDLWRELGLLYVVLLLLILQYATLGMLISSYVQSSDAGVRITYSAVLGLFFLTLLPAAFLRGTSQFGGSLQVVAGWIRHFSPLPAVMEIMGHGDVGSAGLKETSSTGGFILVTLLSSAIFAALTLSRMNYRIFDQSRAQGVITNERGLMARLARRVMYVVDPQRRKPGIPWFLNPVMVKEFRCRRFGRSQWLLRLVAVCAVASMVLTIMAGHQRYLLGRRNDRGTVGAASGCPGGGADAQPGIGFDQWRARQRRVGVASVNSIVIGQNRSRKNSERDLDPSFGVDGHTSRLLNDDLDPAGDVVASELGFDLLSVDGSLCVGGQRCGRQLVSVNCGLHHDDVCRGDQFVSGPDLSLARPRCTLRSRHGPGRLAYQSGRCGAQCDRGAWF